MAWRGLEMTLKGSVGKTQAKGATGRVPYNKAGGAVWYRMRREFGLEGAGAGWGGSVHLGSCPWRLFSGSGETCEKLHEEGI